MKEYNRKNIPLAKNLRKTMTPWERKLWYTFLRFYPLRFQRQKAIGDYIADFYCAKVELVIELDGSGHYSQKQEKSDQLRTDKLKSMNLTVLRICNLDIDQNFDGVCQQIDETVKCLSLSHRHFASRSALTARSPRSGPLLSATPTFPPQCGGIYPHQREPRGKFSDFIDTIIQPERRKAE